MASSIYPMTMARESLIPRSIANEAGEKNARDYSGENRYLCRTAGRRRAVHPAFAQCTFSGGDGSGGIVTFQLPAVFMLDPDTPVGTVIYDNAVESNEITVHCGGADAQIRRGYLTLTDADAREDVLPGVYKTNVPGIGIRAAASSERLPDYIEEDLIRPWQYYGYKHGGSDGTHVFRAAAQLVVIGQVQDGMLDTSRLTSQDTLGGVVVGEMRFRPPASILRPIPVIWLTVTFLFLSKRSILRILTGNTQRY
jgi:hypothetical protein